MKKLCLESNEETSDLIITGDIAAIFGNRRASRYLKDTLKYTLLEDRILIEVEDNINKTIDRVKKICEYISAELIFWERYQRRLIIMHWKKRSSWNLQKKHG